MARKMIRLQTGCVCTLTHQRSGLVWKEQSEEGHPELGPRHSCEEDQGHPGPYVLKVLDTLSWPSPWGRLTCHQVLVREH